MKHEPADLLKSDLLLLFVQDLVDCLLRLLELLLVLRELLYIMLAFEVVHCGWDCKERQRVDNRET